MILLLTTRVSELFPMNCAAKIDCLFVETDGHGKSYGEWKHEKEGSPTLRGMVKGGMWKWQ